MPKPSQNRKKQSVAMTPVGVWPNESPDAMEQSTMGMSVIPLLRPSLSPSQPKKSWPASVPQKATSGGSEPGSGLVVSV